MYRGLGEPTSVPVDYVPPPTGPQAPAGYWINPDNKTEWLPQSDAAKIGGFCLQGPSVGRYKVGGNYSNSTLYCGNLSCQESLMVYGGAAAACFLLLPGNWKWAALIPAAWAGLQCTLGGIVI